MAVTRIGIARGIMLGSGMAGLIVAAPASAQANRTWVSAAIGNDNNACTFDAPCRTFARAINQATAKGVVNCLDPGDYSGASLSITKTVTIDCEGIGTAGVLVTNTINSAATAGISINLSYGNVVVLNGLDINGSGVGSGIAFTGGGALIVRNSSIRNFDNGISSTGGTLTVDNVAISNANVAGVKVSGTARATVVRSQIGNSATGVLADGTASGTSGSVFISLRSSTVTNSVLNGVSAKNGGSSPARFATIAIDDSTISGSGGAGLYAVGNPAGMLVNNSTIGNNIGGGLSVANGGVLYSYGNNRVNGNNGQDGSFTATIAQR